MRYWTEGIAILSLGVICGAWVLVQRWIARRDPGQPGVEKMRECTGCGRECAHRDAESGVCPIEDPSLAAPPARPAHPSPRGR